MPDIVLPVLAQVASHTAKRNQRRRARMKKQTEEQAAAVREAAALEEAVAASMGDAAEGGDQDPTPSGGPKSTPSGGASSGAAPSRPGGIKVEALSTADILSAEVLDPDINDEGRNYLEIGARTHVLMLEECVKRSDFPLSASADPAWITAKRYSAPRSTCLPRPSCRMTAAGLGTSLTSTSRPATQSASLPPGSSSRGSRGTPRL